MNKLKFSLALMIGAFLSGCGTVPYGNHLEGNPPMMGVANDGAKQLTTIYLPAATQFKLTHPATDGFGISIKVSLRLEGFGVIDYEPKEPVGPNYVPKKSVQNPYPDATPPVDISYLLDTSKELYRLKIDTPKATLSRAYEMKLGQLVPVGAWTQLLKDQK